MKQIYYVIQTLIRGRGSNIIKIVSLTLGLTMSIILFARVAFELSFDSNFRDTDHLYQIFASWKHEGEWSEPNPINMGPVAGAIKENFPKEVESAVAVCEYMAQGPVYNGSVRFDDSKVMADSLFFRTMGIDVLKGNPKELATKDVIFLSDRFARKIFGDADPMDKTLAYNNRQIMLTVKGVYASLPENTTLECEAVISLSTGLSREWGNFSWNGGDSYLEYVRFQPGADKDAVMNRLDAMVNKYLSPDLVDAGMGYRVSLRPIRSVYSENDDVQSMVKIMSILGFAILFIVSLNYVLMSVSSLSYRAKAVGVHKCSGASGGRIFSMFLMETGIIILLSVLLMALLMWNFRDFIEDTAVAKLSSLFAFERIWVPISVVLGLFLIGGILPGKIFSCIPVSQVFRRYSESKKGWKRPLLFIQFTCVAFISGLMCVVMAQYDFAVHRSLGYNPQRIVTSSAYFGEEKDNEVARTLFSGLPYVEEVSASYGVPMWGYSGAGINDANGKIIFSTRFEYVMENYLKMMQASFKAGRMAQADGEVVVNETFVDRMHWGTDVIGRQINQEGKKYKVVGLIQDYKIGNIYTGELPLVLLWKKNFSNVISIKLKEPVMENMIKLQKVADEAFPNAEIRFRSMEVTLNESYNAIRVFRNATMLSTLTMILVMLMGLIGYTTDEVRRRSKEIAIRKVNGAEASGILELLSRDVLWVAFPAVLLGTVGFWYASDLWIDMFAERVSVSWALYVLVAIAILAVIVGCVLWKSWRIANENPVNSIKSE